jgi:hypothetical protein
MAMRSSLPPGSVPARCHSSWQRDFTVSSPAIDR